MQERAKTRAIECLEPSLKRKFPSTAKNGERGFLPSSRFRSQTGYETIYAFVQRGRLRKWEEFCQNIERRYKRGGLSPTCISLAHKAIKLHQIRAIHSHVGSAPVA